MSTKQKTPDKKGVIDADLEDLTPQKLLFLVQQVMDCLQNENGQSPYITVLCDDVMLFELDEYRYRIIIQNINQYS